MNKVKKSKFEKSVSQIAKVVFKDYGNNLQLLSGTTKEKVTDIIRLAYYEGINDSKKGGSHE